MVFELFYEYIRLSQGIGTINWTRIKIHIIR